MTFRRVTAANALAHPSRQLLMDAIEAQPGIGLRALLALTGIPAGTASHHVQLLCRTRLVVRQRDGAYIRHFPATLSEHQRTLLAARAAGLGGLLDLVARIGPAPQNTIIRAAGDPWSTCQHKLARLVAYGLVKATWQGRCRIYEV